MKPKHFIPLIIFFPVLLFQLTVVPLISIDGVVPDLILITLIYFTIAYGQIFGTVTGAAYGLMFDLIAGSLIGSAMLSKTVAGFIAGYFSGETRRDKYLNTYSFTFVVFLCALCDSIIFSFFSAIDFNTNIFLVLFDNALLPSVYTAAVSLIIVVIPYRRSFE